MKIKQILRNALLAPGTLGFSIFYSMLVTELSLIFFHDNDIGNVKFIVGPILAFIAAVSIHLEWGQMLNYIDEYGSLKGFRKEKKMLPFQGYIWITIFMLLVTLSRFSAIFSAIHPSWSIQIGLTTGMIITTLGITIALRKLPWHWRPN